MAFSGALPPASEVEGQLLPFPVLSPVNRLGASGIRYIHHTTLSSRTFAWSPVCGSH